MGTMYENEVYASFVLFMLFCRAIIMLAVPGYLATEHEVLIAIVD